MCPNLLPESQYILSEITIRNMLLPHEVELTKRSLIRWFALSLGLISPKESRTLILDIIEALIYFHLASHQPTTEEIISKVAELRRETKTKEKAIRYHITQLVKRGILTRKRGKYSFYLNPENQDRDLGAALEYLYMQNARTSFTNIKRAVRALLR
ncbi:MAG: hypothetical protein QXW70_02610 [Candidatus Anstonellales archaeon]